MEKLFHPVNIGALDLAHRVVMPGIVDYRRAASSGPADAGACDCVRRAAPGGLVFTPPVPVSSRGALPPFTDGFDAPAAAGVLGEAVAMAHAKSARIVARLWHAGQDAGLLDDAGIDLVLEDYRRAARHARRLGFDAVELDAADGALPDRFLQDGANCRRDRYGGPVQNRLNLLAELADLLVAEWGAERVGVRLSPFGTYRGMSDTDPPALFEAVLGMLAGQEIAFIHLVRTDADGAALGHLPYEQPGFGGRLRAAFPSAIIVSGDFPRDCAVDLVRRRWADAIGVEDGPLAAEAATLAPR
ncbi:oxidoreductase [Azospirillum picis]|uniref:N-ethylmaleimide reductase n=1 Tax=Azospirillum picis TaxID=488438 RepID=A0ABU0MMV8_9PROT|nr:hypothetical protein [Azospirillum picis]MBP2301237.1 N-ethylmaleimide reductase [Azospirillum picis]MDQ0534800.1 N-ethylmaleimide reductase [Azospirillum picis]